MRFVELQLPLHAAPREIEFISVLPLNRAGEVDRLALGAGRSKGVL